MRSTLGSHFAGMGTYQSFIEEESLYKVQKAHVTLTHDPAYMEDKEFDKLCADMAGEVTTYYVEVGK